MAYPLIPSDFVEIEANFTDEELKEYFKLHLIYLNVGDKDYYRQNSYRNGNSPHPWLFEWPRKTILFSSISHPFVSVKYMNTTSQHAESLLLKNLFSQFNVEQVNKSYAELSLGDVFTGSEDDDKERSDEDARKLTIYITQNYSPCCDCADKIIDFIEKCKVEYNYDIQMCISFGTFYCFSDNEKGLVSLLVAGVDLQLIDGDLRNRIKVLVTDGLDESESSKMYTFFSKREKLDKEYMDKIQQNAKKKKEEESNSLQLAK